MKTFLILLGVFLLCALLLGGYLYWFFCQFDEDETPPSEWWE